MKTIKRFTVRSVNFSGFVFLNIWARIFLAYYSWRLRSKNKNVRIKSVEIIGGVDEFVDPSIPRHILIKTLADPDRQVRLAAIGAIQRQGIDDETAQQLEKLLGDNDRAVNQAAAQALSGRPVTFDYYYRELKSPKSESRAQAVQRIAILNHPRLIPALLEALEDNSAEVRQRAIEALDLRGDATALAALRNVAQNDTTIIQAGSDQQGNIRHTTMRELAAAAIASIEERIKSGITPLQQSLQENDSLFDW
ncbi:MAG TPA: HEAT repeat domain-containing protein [Chloroflexia bacterium]|nr:HEAT repeat domain-containing protein [Chloroflexia bacterium]